MGRADYFKPGGWNGKCQRCAEKYKFAELRLEWDGLYVCEHCFEIRHPQDFVRGVPDNQSVPASTSNPPWINVSRVTAPGLRTLDAYLLDSISIG